MARASAAGWTAAGFLPGASRRVWPSAGLFRAPTGKPVPAAAAKGTWTHGPTVSRWPSLRGAVILGGYERGHAPSVGNHAGQPPGQRPTPAPGLRRAAPPGRPEAGPGGARADPPGHGAGP